MAMTEFHSNTSLNMKLMKLIILIWFISISFAAPFGLWALGIISLPGNPVGFSKVELMLILGAGGILGLISLVGLLRQTKRLFFNRNLTLLFLVFGMIAVSIISIDGFEAFGIIHLFNPAVWFLTLLPIICTVFLIHKNRHYLFDINRSVK